MKRSKETIIEIKEYLDHKLGEATRIITELNSKTKEEFEELGIEDRADIVLEVKFCLTKINLMLQLENKCQNLEV